MESRFPHMQNYKKSRPTRQEAMDAIFRTYLNIQTAFEFLEEIFKRENDYRFRRDIRKRKAIERMIKKANSNP